MLDGRLEIAVKSGFVRSEAGRFERKFWRGKVGKRPVDFEGLESFDGSAGRANLERESEKKKKKNRKKSMEKKNKYSM